MRSRFLVVAAAWLLGALVALGGSLLAVNGIAHWLLGTDVQPVAVTQIQADIASHQASSSQPVFAPTRAAAGDGNDQDSSTPAQQPAVITTPQPTPSPSPPSGGSLVVSPGGSVMASCQAGLAYLQYWSPNPGYQADDVIRGPAARASIGFEHLTSEYQIWVTCNGSKLVT